MRKTVSDYIAGRLEALARWVRALGGGGPGPVPAPPPTDPK